MASYQMQASFSLCSNKASQRILSKPLKFFSSILPLHKNHHPFVHTSSLSRYPTAIQSQAPICRTLPYSRDSNQFPFIKRKKSHLVAKCSVVNAGERYNNTENEGLNVDTVNSVVPEDAISKICAFVASLFPLWVAFGAGSALVWPHLYSWIQGNVMVAALALTMLGMGMTLSLDDLKGAFAMPRQLVAGVFLQYTVMPALGAVVTSLMGLPHPYAVGLLLVACCPGGTASNIVTYLARGNVALSVLMTATSTLLAVVMTPLLTARLAGQLVPVDAAGLILSTLQVVFLPVVSGALANHFFPKQVQKVSPFAPVIAVLTVAAVVGSAVASSSNALHQSGAWKLLQAVGALHGGGFLLGYLLSRFAGFDTATSRTVSIEVGMQNSVLGVFLALQHFGDPATAAPCALSSVTHSILGSLLAAFWRWQVPTSKTLQA